MSLFECHVPFIDDMGSISPFVVRESAMQSKEEDALWHVNNMRDHDGLHHLDELPEGVAFLPKDVPGQK